MRARSVPALLLGITLTTLVLAGCIGDTADDVGNGADTGQVVLEDVMAALAAGNTSANLDKLGSWDDGGNQEIDAWGHYLAVMQNPTLYILNVSDVSDITVEGELNLPGVKDVKWSDDGDWIIVGHDGGLSTDNSLVPTSTAGFYVVDASDKTAPKQASHLSHATERRGPHMVFYHEMPGGDAIVLGANADISINAFDKKTGELSELARYSPDIVTDWNRDPHVVDAYYQGYAHDMFAMNDPVDNKTYMYVANWDAGLRIVDVTDPANPEEVGKWMDYPESHSGNLHTVSTDWIGDRRITVGTPELGFYVVGGTHYVQGDELSGVYVWDTTDPANIELLTYWTHPLDTCKYAARDVPVAPEGTTSSHNIQFEDGRVYLAHYDCGVWVLDLVDQGTVESPELVGYYVEDGMHTWDVIVHQGQMFLGDNKALFALHFPVDVLGPEGLNSRA